MPFFLRLVKDSPVPGNMNLFAWYRIFLADAVVTYLLYGYKTEVPSGGFVGNSIATESCEKNYRDMRRFNFLYMLLAGCATVCLLCLYFYLLKAGDMRWIYHQGAGLWWKDRYIVVAEIVCNVVLNILLVKYWGVLGIILATLSSLFFVNFIGGAWILFKEYFQNGKLGEFFGDQAKYFWVTVAVGVVCFYICEMLTDGTGIAGKGVETLFLLLRLLICTVVTALLYYLVYHRTLQYQDAKDWLWKRYRAIK